MHLMYLVSHGVMPEGNAKRIVEIISDFWEGVAEVEHKLPMLYKVPEILEYNLVLAKVSFKDSDTAEVCQRVSKINNVLEKEFGLDLRIPVKMSDIGKSDKIDTTHYFTICSDMSMWQGLFEPMVI